MTAASMPTARVQGPQITYQDLFVSASPPNPISPRDYLKRIAGEDFYLLDKIIWCESGWKPNAKNANSTASGLFQFIASTWTSWGDGDVFDPYDNLDAGYELYKARGTSPWLASASCWQNK